MRTHQPLGGLVGGVFSSSFAGGAAVGRTEFSANVIRDYVLEGLKSIPGIARPSSDKDVVVENGAITVTVACLADVRPYEVSLMAQRSLYYGLYRYTDGKRYRINVLIDAIRAPE